jgi:ribosomal protein S12 methylthiotransferase accessory factor
VTATAKRFRLGTHRILAPEETWQRIRPLLAEAGISRVGEVTALDRLGIPVFQAVRPASRNVSVSQGKGATREAARVSAAMEALELWHAEDLGHLPQIEMTLQEMAFSNPVAAADLLWREGVAPPWSAPLCWVQARAVRGGRPAWLPRSLLELDFRLRLDGVPDLFHRTSNGLASGNCLPEALLHGLCELIERHTLYRARHQGAPKVPLDPAAIEAPACRELVERVRAAGATLALYDLTGPLGVPVAAAEIWHPEVPRLWAGSGCHPSPEVALCRALTEAAQSRLTYLSGARDDLPDPGSPDGAGRAAAEPPEPVPGRRLAEVPDLSTASVAADLERVAQALGRAGHEPYFVELTRPELGVAVARAFAPGLAEAHSA